MLNQNSGSGYLRQGRLIMFEKLKAILFTRKEPQGEDKTEKNFTISLSVMSDWGDSVVGTGHVKDGSYKATYFNDYKEAIEYLRTECEKWVNKQKGEGNNG
jgi:hypothetical protein